ncbi:MAG: hypothetical protein AAGC43_16235 [Bacteroidota bacterium]
MGLVLILLGCFLLYAKSRHFPKQFTSIGERMKKKPELTRWVAYLMFLLSASIFAYQLGIGTGLTAFFISVLLGLCLTIVLLPLNKKYVYVLGALSVIVIVMENIL